MKGGNIMASESIKKNIVPQQTIIKRPVGRPRNPNKKFYVKKGTPRTGRPKIYTKEIADYICEQLMEGRTLTAICREEKVPVLATVFGWLRETSPNFVKEFLKAYLVARQVQGEVVADQAMDIADDGRNDTYFKKDKNGKMVRVIDYDNVQRSRLRVEHKRWLASKLYPRKFSDRMQLTGNENEPLVPTETKIVVKFIEPDKTKYENEGN
jgi:hypothetical protein